MNELLEDLQGFIDVAILDDNHYDEACGLIERIRELYEHEYGLKRATLHD